MPQLAVVLVLLLSPIPAVAGGPALPEGWRLPNSDELGASWRTGALRNAVVLADFNGDGLSDGAYVAVRSDGSGFGVLAFVSAPSGLERWFEIAELPAEGALLLGLQKREPGRYSAWGPEGNDAPRVEVRLSHPGFAYFQPEVSSTLVLWRDDAHGFEQHTESE